ncbi:uncharacterized protein LOC126989091 isoform X11 [Eriocheir sinensis]|uniref:uncharacterized protein LOC126989091 isoform X8 n=1 Tax=Eriocheir sinensis TaxID=95602 RepID=UPI0021C78956|nr:uncharacterized protein LOC126989091 isoform X8 [Eriocheir sinensis]XP_050703662.1 uncharacterized protein LOC126989091 isoform X9 [Eriocheir sinensis]XP_050703664.1 uncharacterized protein LOC126989091 isoform X10 [Eriocheir sinensis]XP_050703668.1 uncharacterized protein LOC126989091 isoform X11 [Eriocheir sinensis]
MLAALWSAGGPGPRDLIFSSLFFGNTRSINQAKERVFPGCLGRDGRAKEDSRRVGWVEGPTLPLSCSSRLALPSHHWDSRRVGWVEGPTLPLSCSSRLALPSHHWDSRRVGWVEGPTLPLSCSSRLALPSHHWDSRRVGWVEGPTLPLSCSSRLALPSHHWEGLLAMSVALRNTCCPLALKAGLQPEWPGAAEQTVTGVRTKA